MPIYDEKLICPLAVRFSQDHIRPEFQKGGSQSIDLEAAINAITTKPGSGDYDIVLVHPFPQIEIIRGHLKSGDKHHWLSLDNRRLYCLQRAAVAHWPLRAAVVVDALRAPTEGMRKKVNSSVDGLSVGIGHSSNALLGRFDWHLEVDKGVEAELAYELVTLDDAKANIQDLAEAPAPPSMLDLFFQNEKTGEPSDSSTVEPRSPRDSEGSGSSDSIAAAWQESAGDWMPDLVGTWEDDKGNSYSISPATDCCWSCMRKSAGGGKRKFALWYDAATDSVSWGDDWSCWADASDIRYDGSWVSWYAGRDAGKRKPRCEWWKVVQGKQSVPSKQGRHTKSTKKATV